MASAMVIKVRYFGTTKIKVAGSARHVNARVDKNGELDLDMGGLRQEICSLFNLPLGADITLIYIDEDGDVVTLVDDDDLRDAVKQNLKSFRIDVLMNENREGVKYSSSKKSVMDAVNVTNDVQNSMEIMKATTSYVNMSSNAFYECPFESFDHPVTPTMACFQSNHSEAIGRVMCHTGVRCCICDCQPIMGSRFKSCVRKELNKGSMEDYSLCRICFASWGNVTDYIRIDHPFCIEA